MGIATLFCSLWLGEVAIPLGLSLPICSMGLNPEWGATLFGSRTLGFLFPQGPAHWVMQCLPFELQFRHMSNKVVAVAGSGSNPSTTASTALRP